jgi:DNA-binding response OmpR family regulator
MAADDSVVLVVEDEPDVAETYQLWLETEYEVRRAADGDQALASLDERVDVVLLDRMMPGLSGDDVLEHIRTEELDCRVAMVTAVEPDFDILEMGFDAYLSKPVRSEQLRETVANLLERSAYDDLLQQYYALVEKRATLDATKTRAELANSDEYERLSAEIERLRAELSETIGGIGDDEEFVTAVRELDDDE